ncbi:hypothetical protein BD410DRAFT_808107 [Rickenella mellea]|uniref:Uncharacterized protein n=1 Tax=Rickenella mellea TaxID=50990 RepID=A0A4Y7PN25_9AGAM|nr:hypothetical protein BD410DRAFT_808107 [Rickenella mellea]
MERLASSNLNYLPIISHFCITPCTNLFGTDNYVVFKNTCPLFRITSTPLFIVTAQFIRSPPHQSSLTVNFRARELRCLQELALLPHFTMETFVPIQFLFSSGLRWRAVDIHPIAFSPLLSPHRFATRPSQTRPLKRQATSDVDNPRARLRPPPSETLIQLPALSTTAFPFDPATSRIPSTPLNIDKSPSLFHIPASQFGSIISEPIATPPALSSAISITSTVDSFAPSSPPAPHPAISITSSIDSFPSSSPPAPRPAISINSSIDSFPPPPPPVPHRAISITSSIDSFAPTSPSLAADTLISIASTDDDLPPSSPPASLVAGPTASTIDTIDNDLDFHPCDGTHPECLATDSPDLSSIFPCIRYMNDIVILHTVNEKSPTQWSFTGSESTYILHGLDFILAYNKALPKVYIPFVRIKTDDILPVSLRRRINQARPASKKREHEYKLTGLPRPLSTLSHLAAVLLRERNRTELMTTFSWLEPRGLHTFDIIPKALLTRH